MQKLRSMKISKQLILTFGITVIMFLSIIVTVLYSAATISDNYTDFYEKSFEVVRQVCLPALRIWKRCLP